MAFQALDNGLLPICQSPTQSPCSRTVDLVLEGSTDLPEDLLHMVESNIDSKLLPRQKRVMSFEGKTTQTQQRKSAFTTEAKAP